MLYFENSKILFKYQVILFGHVKNDCPFLSCLHDGSLMTEAMGNAHLVV